MWHDVDGAAPSPITEATRTSLCAAAQKASREAEEALDRVHLPHPEQEPLLSGGKMGRRDSEPDMMQRLSHDAQPANMLQRLSGAQSAGGGCQRPASCLPAGP